MRESHKGRKDSIRSALRQGEIDVHSTALTLAGNGMGHVLRVQYPMTTSKLLKRRKHKKSLKVSLVFEVLEQKQLISADARWSGHPFAW